MTDAAVTLANGEVVDSTDPQWRDECLARHRHVLSMRNLGLDGRRSYIANVERSEGAESARRLRDAFTRDWEDRKAAERTAQEAQRP